MQPADNEVISEAAQIIAIASCDKDLSSFRTCLETNNLKVESPKEDVQRLCGQNLRELGSCVEKTDEKVVARSLFEFSSAKCPEKLKKLEDCQKKGASNCQNEYYGLLVCGSKNLTKQSRGS